MKLCNTCYRLNLGKPLYCMGCGVALGGVRRCLHCGHANNLDAHHCGHCGKSDLSDSDKPAPVWLRLVNVLLWGLALLGIVETILWLWNSAAQMVPVLIPILLPIGVAVAILPKWARKLLWSLVEVIGFPLRVMGHRIMDRILPENKDKSSRSSRR